MENFVNYKFSFRTASKVLPDVVSYHALKLNDSWQNFFFHKIQIFFPTSKALVYGWIIQIIMPSVKIVAFLICVQYAGCKFWIPFHQFIFNFIAKKMIALKEMFCRKEMLVWKRVSTNEFAIIHWICFTVY